MKLDTKTIIMIAAALVVLGGAYWYFFSGTQESSPLTELLASDNAAQLRFQTLISELDSVSFNSSLFTDPRFTSLIDITTPIAPEAAGRIDPFATFSASTKSR